VDGAPLLSLQFNPGPDLEQAARDCEASVFLRAYGNTREQLRDEYGPYEDASVFIALSEPGGDVLGCCRLIRPGPAGLKTLHDVSRPPWSLPVDRSVRAARLDLTRTWDVATLGARRGLKGPGRLASAALFHGVVQAVRANEVQSAVMIIDERVRTLLAVAGMFGRALPGASPARYLGSAASTPVYEHCAQAFDRQRTHNPDAYRLYVQGGGLDGISVGEPASFRLPQPAPLELELAGSD
jgi:N-acyl-L-homoserine lactone synthetase